ncbi:MAG: hypothetical protein JWL96_76 [Sphingomonas bacterium]|uniref:hypothetical protein n=1 Tax=Sphingomonas bacterium TaxID=1895847 RepID=UPI0026263F1C|nr:hypothetical protein [Sphingomonas bacterium]MDB5708006.1 hypothetical protein [Sphingomonas bacterium]
MMNDRTEATAIDTRFARLERRVRRQQIALLAMGLVAGAGLLAAFAPAQKTIDTQAIRIVDAHGKPRILIGAPPPVAGRLRKDGQTASIVFLGDDGADRLIVGQEPLPRVDGKTYPRVADGYGLVLHDSKGSERGAVSFLDNGRGVIALDRPGGDAVAMIVNDRSGFAGVTVNYANNLGSYQEGVRLGTKNDEAWLSLQDRPQGERARLSTAGSAAPQLVTRPAGAPPAP